MAHRRASNLPSKAQQETEKSAKVPREADKSSEEVLAQPQVSRVAPDGQNYPLMAPPLSCI